MQNIISHNLLPHLRPISQYFTKCLLEKQWIFSIIPADARIMAPSTSHIYTNMNNPFFTGSPIIHTCQIATKKINHNCYWHNLLLINFATKSIFNRQPQFFIFCSGFTIFIILQFYILYFNSRNRTITTFIIYIFQPISEQIFRRDHFTFHDQTSMQKDTYSNLQT